MKTRVVLLIAALLLSSVPDRAQAQRSKPFAPGYTKTPLLADKEMEALAAELNGLIAKDTIIELSRHHRVQGSSGFASAAQFIAARARDYGLEQVNVERFAADGAKTYHTLRSTPGWEATVGELWESAPRRAKIADYEEMRVALADYSQSAEVQAALVDVGDGTAASDYEGKEVRGKIVLAGGNVAAVHALACNERGAAGILSYQQNQSSGWSGDYVDNVRWGHLSPYNAENKFAFMISLRQAREFKERLARGEAITLQANVKAEIKPGSYDVVTAIIRGTEAADEEVIFSCHLCHQKPGANDNASGAAAILEIGRALTALIRRGEIERPRRTLRFIFPPEINGTLAYFAEHPEIVRRMKAAVHCDMVGGNPAITKAVLHVTHTPASLPSVVNLVGDIFTEYAIRGSARAAAGEGLADALISPGGGKEALVADITPHEMGSDHDVYQEGSFRVPTLYLRDWPDVFIHTNNDKPENIDATKMKRSAFIAGASGYFLARATAAEASRLADEIFARAMAKLPRDRARAAELEARGEDGAEEARNLIARALEREAEIFASALALAPRDQTLEAKVETYVEQLSGAWLLLTGKISEQRKGNRTLFTIEPKEPPKENNRAKPKTPKEASRPRSVANDYSRVLTRQILGPMNVYYYDYVRERASGDDLAVVARLATKPQGSVLAYEILNLVDGKRSIQAIRDYLFVAYGNVTVEEVADYLRVLEKIGVVK